MQIELPYMLHLKPLADSWTALNKMQQLLWLRHHYQFPGCSDDFPTFTTCSKFLVRPELLESDWNFKLRNSLKLAWRADTCSTLPQPMTKRYSSSSQQDIAQTSMGFALQSSVHRHSLGLKLFRVAGSVLPWNIFHWQHVFSGRKISIWRSMDDGHQ